VIETAGNALWVSPLTFVEASTPGTGGFFESAGQRVSVQHISPITTPAGYRPATFLESALHNTGWVALIGLALFLLALGLVVSWRVAVIGLIAVPVALVMAAYVLYLRGSTFTTITLLGLGAALCIVIDDVVRDIDAVRRGIAASDAEGAPRFPR